MQGVNIGDSVFWHKYIGIIMALSNPHSARQVKIYWMNDAAHTWEYTSDAIRMRQKYLDLLAK